MTKPKADARRVLSCNAASKTKMDWGEAFLCLYSECVVEETPTLSNLWANALYRHPVSEHARQGKPNLRTYIGKAQLTIACLLRSRCLPLIRMDAIWLRMIGESVPYFIRQSDQHCIYTLDRSVVEHNCYKILFRETTENIHFHLDQVSVTLKIVCHIWYENKLQYK